MSDRAHRIRIATWVAASVMPHEPAVRASLMRSLRSAADVDDLIQEAYARISGVTAFDQIAQPGHYFFEVARNLLVDHVRRESVVRFDAMADTTFSIASEAPSPEQVTAARRELARVERLIDALPPRCRRIFRMRKMENLSQREIARQLGVSESVVENDGVKGLRLLMQAMRQPGNGTMSEPDTTSTKARER